MFMGQHFEDFFIQLKNRQLNKLSAKIMKTWYGQNVFFVLF